MLQGAKTLDSDLSRRYIDTAGVCQGARGGLRWSLQQRGQMWRWFQERLQQFNCLDGEASDFWPFWLFFNANKKC